MKSHSKIFNYVSFAVIALGLAACGSGNSAAPPTLASPGTVGTTCGVQNGYVYTQDGELPQGSCQPGYGQVQGEYGPNGTPMCLPAIQNGNTTCEGQGGIYPGQYPGGVYPGQYPGVGVGGGGTFGYPYNQNGGIYYGVYNYNSMNTAGRCLTGGTFNGVGCVY